MNLDLRFLRDVTLGLVAVFVVLSVVLVVAG